MRLQPRRGRLRRRECFELPPGPGGPPHFALRSGWHGIVGPPALVPDNEKEKMKMRSPAGAETVSLLKLRDESTNCACRALKGDPQGELAATRVCAAPALATPSLLRIVATHN